MNIIIRQLPDHHIEDLIEDVLNERQLRYYAVDVADQLEFNTFDELKTAVERAMQACVVLKMPLEGHFKAIYKPTSSGVICDWKVSKLGKALICLNGLPTNPQVAKMQVELIKRMIGQ